MAQGQEANNATQSRMEIDANVMNRSDYKEFLKTISCFDNTTGSYPIEAFLKDCKLLSELSAGYDNRIVLRTLISKCKGEPLERVSNADIETVDELIKFLTKHYRKSKDVAIWIEEFTNFKQKKNEKVLDFSYRIGVHLKKTLAEIKLKGGTRQKSREDVAEEMAIRAFIKGLSQKISVFLESDYASLAEATTDAEKTEKKYDLSAQPENSQAECFSIQNNSKNDHFNRSQNSHQNNKNPQQINKYCNYCKKSNHNISECRVLQKKNNEKPQNPHANLECNYCKIKGHIIRDCRKRKYNEQVTKNTQTSGKAAGNGQTSPRYGATTGHVPAQRQQQVNGQQE